MAVLDSIRACVSSRQYLFSRHAADQLITRDIAVLEVEQALLGQPEVIEDYPLDKHGPSYLILGYTDAGRPLHVQCVYSDATVVKIVTVYQPDPERWIDMRTRRRDRGT